MRVLFSVLAVAMSAAACVHPSAAAAQSGSSDTTAAHPWIARLSAIGTSGTLLTGLVRLTPNGKPNEYKAVIELRGAKLGNKIPWSIGTGNCGEGGAREVGERLGYRMIEASADGMARLTTTVKVPIPEGTYHVSFFAGPASDQVVSCGPLVAGT